MLYIAVHIKLDPATNENKEIITALLDNCGFEGVFEQEQGLSAYVPEDGFSEEVLYEIIGTLKSIGCEITYTLERIPPQNWNKIWESNFQPVLINNQVAIRAPFHQEYPDVRYQITIEPKMSFGTGHHHTTRLMIEQMLGIDFNGKMVLDMGCGTGVLAILASKLGADQTVAIDIDNWAYENTIENIEKNSAKGIEVILGSVEAVPEKQYDVILANINRNILISQLPYYSKYSGTGTLLLLSGILTADIDLIQKAAENVSFSFIGHYISDKWAMMIFNRN